MGKVLLFSRTLDVSFVERHARRMAAFRHHKGEQHLLRLLASSEASMRRRGIEEEAILQELAAIESAIRVALWRHVLLEHGGSA